MTNKTMAWLMGLAMMLGVVRPMYGAGTTGADFLLSVVPAEAASLAAGTARWGGSESLVWNPAGVMGQAGHGIALTHYAAFGDTVYEQVEGIAGNVWGGNWSGKILYASTGAMAETDATGRESGAINNYDLLAQAGYARMIFEGVAVGIGLKGFRSVLLDYESRGMAIDLGALARIPGTALTCGMALLHAGTMTGFAGDPEELPVRTKLGVGYSLHPIADHVVGLYADADVPLTGDDEVQALAGIEYRWENRLTLRAGYRPGQELGGIALGMGVSVAGLGISYAYQSMGELGANHRLTLAYAFGGTLGDTAF